MELGYKDLQAQPVTSWIDVILNAMAWCVDVVVDAIPFMFAGAFAVVFVLFGADAYEGAMMLMGF